MAVMLLLIAGTAVAMVLLVLYSRYLFEENRTRVTRRREEIAPMTDVTAEDALWRTVVDPVEAANRARASKPFAAAYSRAMYAAHETPGENRAA